MSDSYETLPLRMGSIQRWSLMQGEEMGEFDNGDYVLNSDYEELEERLMWWVDHEATIAPNRLSFSWYKETAKGAFDYQVQVITDDNVRAAITKAKEG